MESLNLTINSLKSTSSLRETLTKFCYKYPNKTYLLRYLNPIKENETQHNMPLPIATEAFYTMNQKPSGKENSQNNQNCL